MVLSGNGIVPGCAGSKAEKEKRKASPLKLKYYKDSWLPITRKNVQLDAEARGLDLERRGPEESQFGYHNPRFHAPNLKNWWDSRFNRVM
ncbi:uncharacterized protein LOC133882720 isoform X3 [Alnus glutinosa]|uniref:uncharacterized protein LOC133882720 isoform X3 n=1 Tax=Alnus glutinosa TaxID=3517 RepID=UPI002D773B4D|nr:uncharacterized protein LOC133882720 isoform X3 [Alnus glutinosa]